jgi:predicted DCC family thiol-disulfide oxidoreductase YuxK
MSEVDQPRVLLYDRDCGFCRTALALILAWDRRRTLRPLALQDPDAMALLPGMDEATRMASFHLVEPGGAVHSAGLALTELLRLLPGGPALGALAGAAQPVTDATYGLVAGNRNRLGPLIPERAKARATARIDARSGPAGADE